MTEPTEYYIPSPCIRRCTLNDENVCVGCGRTLDDIRRWTTLQASDQKEVLAQASKRLAKINRFR